MHPPKPWSTTSEPTTYEQIYQYVEHTLDECSNLIDNAEQDYYQANASLSIPNKNFPASKRPLPVSALLAWSPLLNELRSARALGDIRNGKTVRDLLTEARSGTLFVSVRDECISLMKRILDKTTDQLFSTLPALANKINDCMNLMEQYFLSFFDIDNIQDIVQKKKKEKMPDKYLETAYTYEKARWLHMLQVNKSMKILREMPQRIEDPKGISLATLSKECQELSVRCDCTSLSYIFALPECYTEARRALLALRTWLSEDANYNSFIQSSMKLVDEKYVEAKKALVLAKTQLSHSEHRVESFRVQLTKVEQENQTNEMKRDELETRLNNKERIYLSKRLTHEVYVEQLAKMLKESDENPSIDNQLSIERFQQEIRQFAKELPKLKAQTETIQARMDFFNQRKEEFLQMRAVNKTLEHELQTAFEEKILKENEFERLQKCRKIIREIYKSRTTNDLAQKIFYALPIRTKQSGENIDDDLSKALRLVARYIGRDWTRLYWQMPFYPLRGQEEIAKDINSIDDKYHRGDVFRDQAHDLLHKWRRYHTRAKVEDLIQALQRIHRFDIIHMIERRILKPKRSLNDGEEEEMDPRKKEIDELNKKVNRLFDKLRTGAITTHDTYVYSTMGLNPLRPSMKSAHTSRTSYNASSRASINETPNFSRKRP